MSNEAVQIRALWDELCRVEDLHFLFPVMFRDDMLDLEARLVSRLLAVGGKVDFGAFTLSAQSATFERDGQRITLSWVTCKGCAPSLVRIANPSSVVTTKVWTRGVGLADKTAEVRTAAKAEN